MGIRIKIYFSLIIATVFLMANERYSPNPPPIGPYLNGIFSESAPGEVGSWQAIDAYPEISIPSPLRIISMPGTANHLVLSKLGLVYMVNFEKQESEIVLDITDRSFKLGEAGTVGLVLHPEFGNSSAPDKQHIFIFYRHKPEPDEWSELGFNRLSKFQWDAVSQRFDSHSEEILIQQYDRCSWHNGGGLFFGPEGYLHCSLGDEGFEEMQKISTQKLDLGLFSGIIRIDVDNDPTRSHPIIRQPRAEFGGNSAWGLTFSQGYSIPNDNPWLSPDGSALEEFYALGLRSPYSTYYDEMEDRIWLLDVGSDKREEVNKVEKGDNLQWPFMEGTLVSEVHPRPTNLIGKEKFPIFEYDRSVGQAIVSGGIYRGMQFPSLFGKLLLADFVTNKVMALDVTEGQEPEIQTLIPNIEVSNIDLPFKPGITGVHLLDNGEVLISITGEDFTEAGKILKLKQNVILPDPPKLLSDLGVFSNLSTLEPVDGIIPYGVNAPLWSDRALKKRWLAVPSSEKIKNNSKVDWTFPEGSVFIKQFDLPLTTDLDGPTARLETRFFVIGKDNLGYGLTYKWNKEGTDAELLTIGAKEKYDITENGAIAFTQTWDFPSRDQCLSCHNPTANYILGVNTHQLNGPQYYHTTGSEINQLTFLSDQGLLQQQISDPSTLPKSHPLEDESVDLELRIRSYLDSNCSSCHRQGGIPELSLDLRQSIPLRLTNAVKQTTKSQASNAEAFIIQPGNHAASELWIRDASIDENQMPPLARNLVDEDYITALATWIDGLDEDAAANNSLLIYPNPSIGNIILRLADNWPAPTNIIIYAANGELMHSAEYESTTIYLELSHFPAGTYILEARAGTEKILEKLVIL